tara:strand:- start:697 stop:1431 length:735 start_codon:yes stop_codon:yes gene_type:complete
MKEINIEIKNKSFPLKIKNTKRQNLIFKNIVLKIKKGEFISIFGPSGCGKTTLLNMISGLDKNFEGSIDAEKNVSYMFQSPRLFPWLTAIDNIKFPIRKNSNSDKIANGLIKKVGLEKFKNQYPDKLSGGMQRRIALARAFASNPSVLLLDEPFISLDKKIANLLRKLLINLWKKNKPTVIFVSHDLDEAIELADRIFFLSSLPSKILLEYKINLTRPRNINSKKFISLKRLLSSTTRTKSQKN